MPNEDILLRIPTSTKIYRYYCKEHVQKWQEKEKDNKPLQGYIEIAFGVDN